MDTQARVSWAEVLTRVPRQRFIPDVIWRREQDRIGNEQVPVDKHHHPERWADLVAVDAPVTTQVDYGHLDEDGSGWEVTSTCLSPTLTREMLEALDVRPGDRVLEIGTGVGWNAALLAAAGAAVTTIEIDHELAQATRLRLATTSGVQTIIGDGEEGCPENAPYDAVIVTAGSSHVLRTWVEQTRIGGRMVVPLTGDWRAPGIAVLERTEDGAVGALSDGTAFQPLRTQPPPRTKGVDYTIPIGPHRTFDLHPYDIADDRAASFAIQQHVSGITHAWSAVPGSRIGTLWLYAEGSWATLSTLEGPPYEVTQAGPRRLVDEVEAGYDWWLEQGKPGVDAWRIEVGLDGRQRIILDR